MLSFDEFTRLREHACTLHASQQGTHMLSLDAVFAAVVAYAAQPARGPGRPPTPSTPPPDWFREALTRLHGQRVTASSFLMLSGHATATEDDRRSVGRWLRDAGKIPKKIGGQQMFQL
ncbi:hypothetical protein Murka_0072 [Xanthomonas phage Murka]|nr:hypothetical protein Murka_0072 [Xanthomonas phage Murka]